MANITVCKAQSHQGCTWTSPKTSRNSLSLFDIFKVLCNVGKYDKDDYFIYILFGALGALGFAPYNFYPIFIAVFSWFSFNLFQSKTSLSQAFLFFTAYYMANVTWIVDPLTVDLSKHFVIIPFAATLIPMYLALQMLIPVVAVKYIRTERVDRAVFAKALLFPAVFSAVLYLQGYGMFGFPWVLPGYIWNSHELFMQFLSFCGIYGFSLITMMIPSFIGAAAIFREKAKENERLKKTSKSAESAKTVIFASIALAIFLGISIFGLIKLANNQTEYTKTTVRVVQPNIKHEEKKYREAMLNRLLNLSTYTGLTTAYAPINKRKFCNCDIVIWPEATFPYLYSENRRGLNALLADAIEENRANAYLIAGAVRENTDTGDIYNSAIFIDRFGRNIHQYDKIHLVPFGEYIPYRSLLPFQNIANDIGDFSVGDAQRRLFELHGLKIAMAICFESVFPIECMPADRKQTDLMVNITNDGWFDIFGREACQHLQIVRARAVEMGVPLIRAANVGISAVFDPLGRELNRINADCTGYIDSFIPKKLPQQTLYSRFGDAIFWSMCIMLTLIAFILVLD